MTDSPAERDRDAEHGLPSDRDAGWNLADHVDAAWDALVRGAPPHPDPLAPELTAEARRLHALDRTPHADPVFLARLREELAVPTPVAHSVPFALLPPVHPPPSGANGRSSILPSAGAGAPEPRPRRWWGAVERMVAAVLVLGLMGSYVVLNNVGPNRTGDDAVAARLFLTHGDKKTWTEIDAETLADIPEATPIASGGPRSIRDSDPTVSEERKLSADGSTLVSFEFVDPMLIRPEEADADLAAEDITITVRDGPFGAVRSSFHPPAPVWNVYDLSADGSRLLLQRGQVYLRAGQPDLAARQEWFVFDTADGRLSTTIVSDDPGAGPGGRHSAWLSPDGRRVFRLILDDESGESNPSTLRLVVHDASTGAERGRVDLPDAIRAGMWTTDRRIADRPVREYVFPAQASSPDGRTLAFVDGTSTVVTLIDTDRIEVGRTVTLAAPEPAVNPPATPEAARLNGENMYEQGRIPWAAFTADGTGLYLDGWDDEIDATGQQTCRSLEVRRVDLATGAVVGRAAGLSISPPLWIAPDGRSVYGLDDQEQRCSDDPGKPFQFLRRLDAESLAPLAERRLADYFRIELVPRLPNGW